MCRMRCDWQRVLAIGILLIACGCSSPRVNPVASPVPSAGHSGSASPVNNGAPEGDSKGPSATFEIESISDGGSIPGEAGVSGEQSEEAGRQGASPASIEGASSVPGTSGQPELQRDPKLRGDIVLGRGMAGVRLGESREEVIAHLGKPDNAAADGSEATDVGIYLRKGLMLNYDGDRVVSVQAVLLDGEPVYEGTTAEGVGIGSTREEVVAAYGKADLSTANALMYAKLKTLFAITGGRVSSICVNSEN